MVFIKRLMAVKRGNKLYLLMMKQVWRIFQYRQLILKSNMLQLGKKIEKHGILMEAGLPQEFIKVKIAVQLGN